MKLCGQSNFPGICIIPISKQKRASQLPIQMEHDIATASELKFLSTLEEMLTWSSAFQMVSSKMVYVCQLWLRNPLDCLTYDAEWAMVLPNIPQVWKLDERNFSYALLSQKTILKAKPETTTKWVAHPNPSVEQFFHKEWNSWFVSPEKRALRVQTCSPSLKEHGHSFSAELLLHRTSAG